MLSPRNTRQIGYDGKSNIEITANIPKMAIVDMFFTPEAKIEYSFFFFFLLYFVPPLIYYILHREHALIKYRQPKMVIISGIICSFHALSLPIIRLYGIICLYNTWICNSLIFTYVIITFSRYVKTCFMQQLSIFKLKFSESKNKKIIRNESKYMTLRSKEGIGKESSLNDLLGSEQSFSLKNSSINNDFEPTLDSCSIIDPIVYLKRLDSIINKKITIFVVFVPVFSVFVYNVVITVLFWNSMKISCVNEIKYVSYPKLALNITIFISSFYLLYQAYRKQKWDREIKIEFTFFVLTSLICTIFMQLTIFDVLGETLMQYRVYIFELVSATVHLICIIIPSIKIYREKVREDDDKLTEEEFIDRLRDTTFKNQVTEIATNTFCIENLLFFDAHCDLMNVIISYYSKKSTLYSRSSSTAGSNGFISTDILHKNTISPILYRPFEPIFKPQYEEIYNLYIKRDGFARINLKSSTFEIIEDQVETDNYTYLMFNQAAEEVGELLYSNIYPKMTFPL